MLAGRVRVNGVVVKELGTRVIPDTDRVELDGMTVALVPTRWVAFHKPSGVLTTRSDPHGNRTIYDVLPDELQGLRYLGRLDRETEGLLLLTNAGDAAHALQHPSGEVEREYVAEVAGAVAPDALTRLRRGVQLDDGPARARAAEVLKTERGSTSIRLVLTEGRKREVRRMLFAVGHPAESLRRVRFGSVRLGALPVGSWRDLKAAEIADLERLT